MDGVRHNGVPRHAVVWEDVSQCKAAMDAWKSPDTIISKDFESAIATAGVLWGMVFSPNVFHREQVVAGFEAGRHVFSEKPLATSIEDCIAIHNAHKVSGRLFTTGFVLRYSPLYRQLHELIDEGALGRILSIDANENIAPAHGGYICMNGERKSPCVIGSVCIPYRVQDRTTGSVYTRTGIIMAN